MHFSGLPFPNPPVGPLQARCSQGIENLGVIFRQPTQEGRHAEEDVIAVVRQSLHGPPEDFSRRLAHSRICMYCVACTAAPQDPARCLPIHEAELAFLTALLLLKGRMSAIAGCTDGGRTPGSSVARRLASQDSGRMYGRQYKAVAKTGKPGTLSFCRPSARLLHRLRYRERTSGRYYVYRLPTFRQSLRLLKQ